MRTTIVLITLGLGFCLAGFAQENFFEIPGLNLTGTNVMQDEMGSPAEIPTLSVKPGDIVQESIELQRDKPPEHLSLLREQLSLLSIELPNFPTNTFRVTWRYTNEAAKQTLAFREQHEGQSMGTVIGAFARTQTVIPLRLWRIFDTAERNGSWLEKPVDSIGGLTEEQAKRMIAELRSK